MLFVLLLFSNNVSNDSNDNRCAQDDQDDTFYISAPRELDNVPTK